MTISDCVRMALQKGGKTQKEMSEAWGFTTPQALGVKFNRDSWSGNDLANVAEFTGGHLAFIYPDGQQVLIFPESAPIQRRKSSQQAEEQNDHA